MRLSRKRGYHPLEHPPENPNSNKNGHFPPILGWKTSCAGWSPLEPLLLSTSGPSPGDSEVVIDLIRFEGALGRRTGGATGRGVVGLHRGLSGATARLRGESWVGVTSATTTKSSPTQKVFRPSHTKFVWRPAFYAFSPYKKFPLWHTNLDLNIFSRNSRPNEPGGYV